MIGFDPAFLSMREWYVAPPPQHVDCRCTGWRAVPDTPAHVQADIDDALMGMFGAINETLASELSDHLQHDHEAEPPVTHEVREGRWSSPNRACVSLVDREIRITYGWRGSPSFCEWLVPLTPPEWSPWPPVPQDEFAEYLDDMRAREQAHRPVQNVAREIPGKPEWRNGKLCEWYEGKWREVKNPNRTGWWRFHEHYDRNGYCDNPARGY